MTAAPVLSVRSLVVLRDGARALAGVDLDVAPGEAVGLVGANGAGKTTLLSTVAGLLPRRGGEVVVLAHDLPARPTLRHARRLVAAGVALVPDDRALFASLTARQHLRLALPRGDVARIAEVVERLPLLEAVLDRRAGLLSGGEQQALALARALCRRPQLLLIDEMSAGLAPIVVDQLAGALETARRQDGTAILLVDQQVDRVAEVAGRIVVLDRGEVVDAGPVEQLDLARLRRAPLGDRPVS